MLNSRQIDGLHAEIGGGYSMGPVIIIDAAYIAPVEIEVIALYENGDEIESQITDNETDARHIFSEMLQRHAEPLQKAFAEADLKPGKKYTIFHLGEFGFPVAQKITFHKMELTTHAQYRDAVKLTFTPYRKRKEYYQYFYSKSFIICDGWQDIDEKNIKNTLTDTPKVKTTITKYGCFDRRYIDDAEQYLKNIIAIYKDYKTGADGRQYA